MSEKPLIKYQKKYDIDPIEAEREKLRKKRGVTILSTAVRRPNRR